MLDPVDPRDIRHLVILGHPDGSSFNHAVAKAYCDAVDACGETAILRDLYASGFDPLLKAWERPDHPDFVAAPDIEADLALIAESAVIVLVYPIWFGMPPAVIKGYVDRVLGSGLRADDIKAGTTNPVLQGKQLVILSSSASSRPWLEEHGQWVSLRQAFDAYLTMIFSFAACDHLHFDTITGDLDDRNFRQKMAEVEQQARKTCSDVLGKRHAAQVERLRRRRAAH